MIGPYYVRGSKPVLRPRRTVLPGRPKGGEFVDQHEIQEEDRTAGPAETADVRIDMGAWLRSLSRRQRTIAYVLASGGNDRNGRPNLSHHFSQDQPASGVLQGELGAISR